MLLSATWLSALVSASLLVESGQCQDVEPTSPPGSGGDGGLQTSPLANRLLVVAMVEDPSSESFQRFNQSVEAYELNSTVVNFDPRRELEQTTDSSNATQLGVSLRKFELVKKTLAVYKDDPDLLVMLVDSTNLIVNGDAPTIAAKFAALQTKLLLSADTNCWPDARLAEDYPPATSFQGDDRNTSIPGQRYLDSRAMIGHAPSVWQFFGELQNVETQIVESLDRIRAIELSQPRTDDAKKGLKLNSRLAEGDLFLQLYSTHVYLNATSRRRLGIALDHKSELLENLHSTKNDVELEFDLDAVNVKNLAYKTNPVVIHGSGVSRVVLNSLGNYLGRAWTQNDGCRQCNRTMISLDDLKESHWPTVLIGVFIEEPTPFLNYFFEHLLALAYPKQRLHLFVHNQVEYHGQQVVEFLQNPAAADYASRQLVNWNGSDGLQTARAALSEREARAMALTRCEQLNCDYYFALDSVAHLELNDTLRLLIETNRTLVAPLLSRPRKLWSNFWGAITPEGYYSRAHDYVELVSRERLGLWNVPHVMNAYLIEGKFLKTRLAHDRQEATAEVPGEESTLRNEIDSQPEAPDAAQQVVGQRRRRRPLPTFAYYDANFPTVKPVLIFSRNLRLANVYQFVNNMHDFGHLVDPTSFNLSRTHPEFYQLENNMLDWERAYLHENYSQLLDEQATPHLESPCQDVYWFPVVNKRFTSELIEIMETFGVWSSGTSDDPRIEGGYESVPTRDIHFKQVGLHDMWLAFLREYIMPVQLKEYIGYEHDPPRTDLAFVVRYHPAEQASLRAHHDSSTYTLNIALNEPGLDYQGGGCRFVRYNCSVVDSRRGWALIHPGRLTHYHEGLPVTAGTRYILVTFVDP